VRYLGWVPHQKIVEYISISDAVYYGLETSDGNSNYSCPNMLFSAMACGKPLITTQVGEISDIVKKERCGIVIERAQPVLIARAVEELTLPSLRLQLGKNGRDAVVKTYNWDIAAGNLLKLYGRLCAGKKKEASCGYST
jgi:glycosyltransferase involved in cell wall biosynthesis